MPLSCSSYELSFYIRKWHCLGSAHSLLNCHIHRSERPRTPEGWILPQGPCRRFCSNQKCYLFPPRPGHRGVSSRAAPCPVCGAGARSLLQDGLRDPQLPAPAAHPGHGQEPQPSPAGRGPGAPGGPAHSGAWCVGVLSAGILSLGPHFVF